MLENFLSPRQTESKVELRNGSTFPPVANTMPNTNSESFKSAMSSSMNAEIKNQHNQLDTSDNESDLLTVDVILKDDLHGELISTPNANIKQQHTNTDDKLNNKQGFVPLPSEVSDELLVGDKMPIDGNVLPEHQEQIQIAVVNSHSDLPQLVGLKSTESQEINTKGNTSKIKNNAEGILSNIKNLTEGTGKDKNSLDKSGTAITANDSKLAEAKLTTDTLAINSKLNDTKFVGVNSGKQEPTILKELLQNTGSLEKNISEKITIDKIDSALNSEFKNVPLKNNNLSFLGHEKAINVDKKPENSPEINANTILSSSVSAAKPDLVGDNGKLVSIKESADSSLKAEINLASNLNNGATVSAVKPLLKEEIVGKTIDKTNSDPSDNKAVEGLMKKDLEKPATKMSSFFGNKETTELKTDLKAVLSKVESKFSESTLDKSNPLTKNLYQTIQSEYSASSSEFKADELKSADENVLNKSTTLSQQFLQYAKLSDKDDLLVRAPINSIDTITNSSANLSNPMAVDMVNSQLQVTGTHQISAKAAEITLPVSLPTHQWNQKFAEHVSMLAVRGASHAQIKLDPPELGPLAVRIHHSGADTQIQFQVQNPVARDLVDSAMHRLREMLEEQGFENVNVDINERNQNDKESFDNIEHGPDSENLLDESEQSKVTVEDTLNDSLVDIFA